MWCGIEGHDRVVERFRNSIVNGRMASTFLFVGPPGIGKRTFAFRFAQSLLCQNHREDELTACQSCEACQQVTAETHTDVDYVCRPEGSANIPIRLLVGDREHRSREGLCHRISLKPSSGRRRIAIIDDADDLNQEGANSLLKTLEEPPPGAVIMLVGTSEQRQLPTIRSRCQIVRFSPLEDAFVADYIRREELAVGDEAVAALTRLAEGSLQRAREFADPALSEFDSAFTSHWSRVPIRSLAIAQDVQDFVNQAGKDAAPRRIRLQQIIELRINRLRKRLLSDVQAAEADNGPVPAQIERCITALQQIRANANLATLIECWVDDLYQLESTQ